MPRPIILGVVGDSASGKTTLTRGLVRLLGHEQVSHVCLDDYHRYDRSQRADSKGFRSVRLARTRSKDNENQYRGTCRARSPHADAMPHQINHTES